MIVVSTHIFSIYFHTFRNYSITRQEKEQGMWSRFAIMIFIIASVSGETAYPRADKARRGADPLSASKTAVNYAKHAVQGFDMRVWISNQMTIGLQAFDGARSRRDFSRATGLNTRPAQASSTYMARVPGSAASSTARGASPKGTTETARRSSSVRTRGIRCAS